MRMDTGSVVILAAVLLFYLRLILIQRRRADRLRQALPVKGRVRQKNKGRQAEKEAYARLSILSPRRQDWVIAGLGVIAIIAGVLFNLRLVGWSPGQAYWWLPVALGIVAFSWAFR